MRIPFLKYSNEQTPILIYKNSNGSKLCDVFKFTFDISDPSFVDVYCYENQITVRLYRDFLVDTTQ